MRRHRRLASVLVAAVLVLSACSSGGASSPPGSPAGGSTGGAASQAAGAPGSTGGAASQAAGAPCTGQVITLTMLVISPGLDKFLVPDWNATHPCVQITVTEVPYGNLTQKTDILAASNNPPDIYTIDGPDIATYAASGVLLPLDNYITPQYKADMVPATLKEESYGGHIYSPGIDQTTVGLFYNKTMTDKLGITPPSTLPGWTWAQAVAAMQKCQQGPPGNATVWGFAPSIFGNGSPGSYYESGIWLRSMGDPKAAVDSSAYKTFAQIAPDDSTVDGYVNSPEAIQGAQFYQDLFNKYGVMPKAGIPNAFIDGKACFDYEASWFLGSLTAAKVPFQWSVTPIPYFVTPISHTGDVSYAVSSKTKYPDQAAALVLFISNTAEELKHVELWGDLPALSSVAAQMPELKTFPLSLFNETLLNEGYPRPSSPHYLQFEAEMSSAMHDIALGTDPKTRLDQAVQVIDQALATKP